MTRVRIINVLMFFALALQSLAQETRIKYLSGTGEDRTVKWDFFVTQGMNSGKWTTIPVPSNWELQGFGKYDYGGQERGKGEEKGMYKYHFTAEKAWAGKQIEIVFEGVMTDAEVKVNGQSAGRIHQGSFYRFQYNITGLIKAGEDNLLEVNVSKLSADPTVNNAEREGDFWIFGGIYRPVYLKILPQTFVERVAVDARDNGSFKMDVFAENMQAGDEVSAQVKTLKGQNFGPAFEANVINPTGPLTLNQSFNNPQLWNPEFPNLYKVEVSIKRNNKVQHVFNQRFGFRTIELRKSDGLYVNGKKILIKGVNRHSAWPSSGRTLSRKIHLQDISLMKEMNMNAVRMSHYPPDPEFLDLCDSLGLFVIDELTGWHQAYGTAVGEKLVKETVTRDVNHPSIILWANGNEGGWNTALDDDYGLYDPQKRTVIHPWNTFNDIDTKHYPEYNYIVTAATRQDVILHTEMIHGLYDGGHSASLRDHWNLIRQNPRHAGGFLWVLADEGIIRKDKQDSIDTDGNHAPDGIVGPYREKEASFYAIKQIWSPVQIKKPVLDATFSGDLEIENTYIYTDLSLCKFTWQLLKFPLAKDSKTGFSVMKSGKAALSLEPGKTGKMHLPLSSGWGDADALQVKAVDQYGQELYTWTWPIKTPADLLQRNLRIAKSSSVVTESQTADQYTITSEGIEYNFDTKTGYLKTVVKNSKPVSFGDGPALAGVKQTLQSFNHQKMPDGRYVVEAAYSGEVVLNVRWFFTPGSPVKLEYSFTEKTPANFYGITFNVDESKITGMKYLGDGPYRTWKNRPEGISAGVWQKKYNNTITGETFIYPEFSGYHANIYWAIVQAGASSFTVYTDKSNLFLQMLKPGIPKTVFVPHVNPPFPEGNLGFLDAIAPIGTKFKSADTMGPQSQKNLPIAGVVTGNLWFDFRD